MGYNKYYKAVKTIFPSASLVSLTGSPAKKKKIVYQETTTQMHLV